MLSVSRNMQTGTERSKGQGDDQSADSNKALHISPLLQVVVYSLTQLTRRNKTLLLIVLDVALIMLAMWAAHVLRFDAVSVKSPQFIFSLLLAPCVTVPVFYAFGIYKSAVRYSYEHLWSDIGKALAFAVIFWFLLLKLLGAGVTFSLVLLFALLAFLSISGVRTVARHVIFRVYRQSYLARNSSVRTVCIYGAGEAGRSLAVALSLGPEIYVAAFIDDDAGLRGTMILGKPVILPSDLDEYANTQKVDEILFAIPSTSLTRKLEIIQLLESKGFNVRNVPGVSQIALGNIRRAWFQDDYIGEILGRQKVTPDDGLLRNCVEGKNVLVTGAGGSIGSELSRQIIELRPKRVVLFELSEVLLYEIEQELRRHAVAGDIELCFILGSVLDHTYISHVVEKFAIDTVYHAAAYKHVPIVEQNVITGLRNNITGTLNAAEAAVKGGVKNFVLVSTDKAVRPTNVMGASKRMAELVVQAISSRERLAGNPINFSIVRFGNVLGSSGSVIPAFQDQIRMGGPVTVTHPEITRYFMTIPEAASLVIQAGAMGDDGDVFVLDMGKPVKILDIARRMIEMAGYTHGVRSPDGALQEADIQIVFTGLRPGEKLYEELLIGENVGPTRHSLIMKAKEVSLSWTDLQVVLQTLDSAMNVRDFTRIFDILKTNVNGYQPAEKPIDPLLGRHNLSS